MSLLVTFNGSNYIIPEPNEVGWGSNLDSYFVAIAAGCLQKTGGTFTLSNETDFGSAFGLKSLYYKTRSSNVASTGAFRLANAETGIVWRNFANNADLPLTVNASNQLTYNGVVIGGSGAFTANRAIVSNGSGDLSAATTTSTEIGYVNGVTSSIQTQLNAKATGSITSASANQLAYYTGATTIAGLTAITASKALASDGSGLPVASTTTATELGYVAGVTSSIQTQINTKVTQGAITTSGLTQTTARILGRTTASTGAIEEISIGASLTLSAGSLNTTQALTTASSPTFAGLTLSSPLTVANGGTGDASLTAYAVLCGGTTSTGAVQSVSGVGSSGQVLTSNGAAALPTWQNVAGSGTVNSGTAGRMSLYATSTNAVSDTYVQNSQNITLAIATQASRSAALAITIPNPGNAVTTANVLLDSDTNTYTIAGVWTHSAALTISPTTNQLVLGTTRTVTITAPTPATTSRTVTIPDLSASYSIVGTEGNQTINGIKTLGSGLLAASGSAGTPGYGFSATSGVGMFYNSGAACLSFSNSSTEALQLTSSQLRMIIGTTANPEYSFLTDLDTGFHRSASNEVSLSLGGSNAYTWDVNEFFPDPDNGKSLGTSGHRWTVVYATTGTINTSHSSTKANIKELDVDKLEIPKGVEYDRDGRRHMGYLNDSLPDVARPIDKNGKIEKTDNYENAVIGILCAKLSKALQDIEDLKNRIK